MENKLKLGGRLHFTEKDAALKPGDYLVPKVASPEWNALTPSWWRLALQGRNGQVISREEMDELRKTWGTKKTHAPRIMSGIKKDETVTENAD